MRSVMCFVLLSTSALAVSAQKSSVTAETEFFNSIPTVVKLPLPTYPTAAKKSGLSGIVSVKITVDETGKVISADDADGPYPVCKAVTDLKVLAMRTAAIEAAKKAKFKSATLDNRQAYSTGRIKYDFEVNVEARPVEVVGARVASSDADNKEMRLDRITKLGNSGTEPPGVKLGEESPSDGTASKTAPGGVLNGTAMELSRPKYPASARAVRAVGQVSVQVLISEQGNVFSARAINGHPLLRRNSEIAACDSRFMPTLLSGQPVKVSGVITYNFVP